MPRVCFTQNLRQHAACPEEDVPGTTVRTVLEHYFARHPQVRGYVLDEHGRLRRHVVVFVGADRVRDGEGLSEAVAEGAEIWVMQALSGGA